MNLKHFFLTLAIAFSAFCANAVDFDKFFENKTLRIDYIFSGDIHNQSVSVRELASLPTWAGRRVNLDHNQLAGMGNVIVTDVETHAVIYTTSFTSLFIEWLALPEPRQRSFEHVTLIPFPKKKIEVTLNLYDPYHQRICHNTMVVDPTDILIRQRGTESVTPHKYIHKSDDPSKCIDVAILAEGYTEAEMDKFYEDAKIATEAILDYEPFKSMKHAFNFVAVAAPSKDSGSSIPKNGIWKSTACSSNFSTFYSDRYLTTQNLIDVNNLLAGIPYEQIVIITNTDEYGGGGIYNDYLITMAHHKDFRPVVVHEFGHSFGGLGDEYFYENDPLAPSNYPSNLEPWEPNLTTLHDFDSKWKSMLKKGTPVPTPQAEWEKYPVGVYEGGGYVFHGVYRPADRCRMRDNQCPGFCPVCQKALKDMILYHLEEK